MQVVDEMEGEISFNSMELPGVKKPKTHTKKRGQSYDSLSHIFRLGSRPAYSDSKSKSLPRFRRRIRKAVSDPGPYSQAVDGGEAPHRDGAPRERFFRVTVPADVIPGDEFEVNCGNKLIRLRSPPDATPGETLLQITVPFDPDAPEEPPPPPPLPRDSPNVRRIEEDRAEVKAPAYTVEIPEGVHGGERFDVTIRGQVVTVTCPPGERPGNSVRIVPPPPPRSLEQYWASQNTEDTQLFEVEVPLSARPGSPFALLAGGVHVLVNCPTNADPGTKIRFRLPRTVVEPPETGSSEAAQIKLSYDKDGWMRTLRVKDMRFQWVRMDSKGDVDMNRRFDLEKSAYTCHLDTSRGGVVKLVPASEALVDSIVKIEDGRDLVTCADIAATQARSYDDKELWFRDMCEQLRVPWDEGHVKINIRRDHLLGDSVDAIMSLSPREMRKTWRFEFIGETGLDYGGLAREWFLLATQHIFDPDKGLWQSSAANQMCMEINPASGILCEGDLLYFRFLGRVMGKALFDGQLVAGHMVQYLYKHILGWPVTFSELAKADDEYYNNLKQVEDLAKSGEDLASMLCLAFSTTVDILGAKTEVELVPDGKNIEVTNGNFHDYLEACFKHRLLGRNKSQVNELLVGFFDVIPEPLLTVFDFQELELLMCGLPEIDMADWMVNTKYIGELEGIGECHPSCWWFWEVVSEYDDEMKARLLQFVTGTSGVPARGFGVLQGNDGNIRKFTINGVKLGTHMYPKAHTCFNRLELPLYGSKEDLREKLKFSITMASTGFDIE